MQVLEGNHAPCSEDITSCMCTASMASHQCETGRLEGSPLVVVAEATDGPREASFPGVGITSVGDVPAE